MERANASEYFVVERLRRSVKLATHGESFCLDTPRCLRARAKVGKARFLSTSIALGGLWNYVNSECGDNDRHADHQRKHLCESCMRHAARRPFRLPESVLIVLIVRYLQGLMQRMLVGITYSCE